MHNFAISDNTFFEAFNDSNYRYETIYDPQHPSRFIVIITEEKLSCTQSECADLIRCTNASETEKRIRELYPPIIPAATFLINEKGISILNRIFMMIIITNGFHINEFPASADISRQPDELFFSKESFLFLYLSNASELINFAKEHALKNIFLNKIIEHYSKLSPISNTLFFMVNNLFTTIQSWQIHYKIPATKSSLEKFQFEFGELLQKRSDMNDKVEVSFIVILTELLLNAYEHGVLGINAEEKQNAVLNDSFDTLLLEREDEKNSIEQLIDIEVDFYENRYAQLRISDGGEGFDYTKDFRSNNATFRGRGLLMVKSMTDALFFDHQGSRSNAFIRLPSADESEPKNGKILMNYTQKLNLLYIEDEESTRLQFTDIFNLLFKNVYLATNGEEGYQLVKRIKPDLIISDNIMPKMTGVELAKKINQLYPDIPFILFTAYSDIEALIGAIDAGIDRLFQKPIHDYNFFRNSLEQMSKTIYFKKEMEKRLLEEELQKEIQINTLRSSSDKYRLEHENAWKKEQLIIHDDSEHITSMKINMLFKPLDILSGDIYSILQISEDQTLFYLIDGMGKGLNASVTSVLSTAFLNRSALQAKEKNDFNFYSLVNTFRSFIQPYLLDIEAISCHFIYINSTDGSSHYSGFGVYPLLLRYENGPVEILKSKNPPLSRYTTTFVTQEIVLQHPFTLLIYTDGLVEQMEKGYNTLLELFSKSNDFTSIKDEFESSSETFDDDVTLLHIEGFLTSR